MAIDMELRESFYRPYWKVCKSCSRDHEYHSHMCRCQDGSAGIQCDPGRSIVGGAKEILNASTTDEAIDILEKYQILQKTMKEILDRIQFYLNHRSYEQIPSGAVIFNNTYGYLGQTADAEKLIKLINAQNDEAQ